MNLDDIPIVMQVAFVYLCQTCSTASESAKIFDFIHLSEFKVVQGHHRFLKMQFLLWG